MVNEEIHITTPEGIVIRIVVTEVRGDKSRIGIEAPKDFKISRPEIVK